jgi:predicted ATP-grasp superfamily ATP-dependent carboligase
MTTLPADVDRPQAGTLDRIADVPGEAVPLAPLADVPNSSNKFPQDGCGALILGGAHGALAVIRSLGRQGIPAWFITGNNVFPTFSRYARVGARWPGPSDARAVEWLLAFARRHRVNGWVLMPCADEEARLLAQNHTALSDVFRLTTPPWPILQWAYDKHRMNARAEALGIDVPHSRCPSSRQDVAALDLRFPVIVKPSVKHDDNALTLAKAWRADDRATLLARYDAAAALVGRDAVLVQELIPGRGEAQMSYAAVWQRGRPVASLVARRTRQYPVDFGFTSTFVETVESDEVDALACRFLSSIDYEGMVEVEFKYDARDRRYKLLDVNARAWTWISLGGKAGVDFPHVLWRLAMGDSVAPVRGQPGVAWMHASRDVMAACQSIAAGHLSLREYVTSLRQPVEFAAFAADDPLPGVLDLPLSLARFLVRRLPDRLRAVSQPH